MMIIQNIKIIIIIIIISIILFTDGTIISKIITLAIVGYPLHFGGDQCGLMLDCLG